MGTVTQGHGSQDLVKRPHETWAAWGSPRLQLGNTAVLGKVVRSRMRLRALRCKLSLAELETMLAFLPPLPFVPVSMTQRVAPVVSPARTTLLSGTWGFWWARAVGEAPPSWAQPGPALPWALQFHRLGHRKHLLARFVLIMGEHTQHKIYHFNHFYVSSSVAFTPSCCCPSTPNRPRNFVVCPDGACPQETLAPHPSLAPGPHHLVLYVGLTHPSLSPALAGCSSCPQCVRPQCTDEKLRPASSWVLGGGPGTCGTHVTTFPGEHPVACVHPFSSLMVC